MNLKLLTVLCLLLAVALIDARPKGQGSNENANKGNGQVAKSNRGRGMKKMMEKMKSLLKSCKEESKTLDCPNSICQAFSVKDKACEKGKTAFADCMKKKKGKNVRRNRARCMKHIVRKGAMMKLRQMKQKRRNGSGKKWRNNYSLINYNWIDEILFSKTNKVLVFIYMTLVLSFFQYLTTQYVLN